jgi:chromatin remodeling complex protein RSC6
MSRTEAPTKTRAAGPGLMKPMTPSPELAAIVGSEPMPRTAVVAKVWDHIRTHGLQDPADKRTIVADDKLRAVFEQDRCTMFEMQKLLSPHLTAM